MGFCKLNFFNLAMLSNFLDFREGSNPFFVWWSIFAAKQPINRGIRWQVGNGRDNEVFKDPLLNDDNKFFLLIHFLRRG
ncbi:hypothetical protein ES332_D11G217800v1 [Gossypium tomentosum]|uniref:Uncharacterized protein n=1 Tax=Gossypium tomentosum TaxID=34277 RepID=A0A5D2IQA9_GOSTO|nr:hypothetical protein ES332_D11G217800v1 [Gossypium tomentosum]